MFDLTSGSAIIDFCIGMSFFYLTLTLVCTMVNEYLMDKLVKLRQKTLLEGIAGVFYDKQKLNDFYKHPLITGLYNDDQKMSWVQILLAYLSKILLYLPSTIVSPLLIFLRKYRDELAKKIKPPQEGDLPQNDSIMDCVKHFKDMKILRNLPAYIPTTTFANTLLDLVTRGNGAAAPPRTCAELREMINQFPNEKIKKALLPLIDAAPDSLEKARQNIEKWFDDTMDRVSGWFKRKARIWLLLVAAIVCLVLNADSIMVGRMLWIDKELRAVVVKQADKYIQEHPLSGTTVNPSQGQGSAAPADSSNDAKKLKENINKTLNNLQLPLGWVCPKEEELNTIKSECLKSLLRWVCAKPDDADQKKVEGQIKPEDKKKPPIKDPRTVPTEGSPIFFKIMGLFFTMLAISFGTPFWTDLLNKFANLRKSGNVPPKAEEKKK